MSLNAASLEEIQISYLDDVFLPQKYLCRMKRMHILEFFKIISNQINRFSSESQLHDIM